MTRHHQPPDQPVDEHAEQPCPGPCNQDFRHAEHDTTDGNHDVPFIPGQPIWCPACRDDLTTKLGELPDLAAHMPPGRLNTPRNVDTHESKALKKSTQPTPSPAWDALDDLIRWAVHLEDDTRARVGHTPAGQPATTYRGRLRSYAPDWEGWHPPLVTPGLIPTGVTVQQPRTLTGAVRYLTGNITAVLSHHDTGETSGRAIRHHHRALTRYTGTDRPTAHIPGQCPACERRGTLRRQDGDDLIKCRVCGATWDWDYYQHLTKILVNQKRAG